MPCKIAFTHLLGISFLQMLGSDTSNKFFAKQEWSLEPSTWVLKSAYCSDEVILWLSLTGRAWATASHLLTGRQVGGVQGFTVRVLSAPVHLNPETSVWGWREC